MLACGVDLLQILQHMLLILDVADGKCRKADDRIHRRPDVVGHIVQEDGLGLIGMLRRSQCIPKGRILLDFTLLFRGHIPAGQKDAVHPSLLVVALCHDQREHPAPVRLLAGIRERLLPLQPLCHRIHIDEFQIFLAAGLRNPF